MSKSDEMGRSRKKYRRHFIYDVFQRTERFRFLHFSSLSRREHDDDETMASSSSSSSRSLSTTMESQTTRHHRHHHRGQRQRRRRKNIASFSTRATERSASLSASSSEENTNTNYNNSSSSSSSDNNTNNNNNNNNTNNNENNTNANEFILYGSQGSRSPLINWYLYEKEVQFELKEPRDVSNPHPFGQVPALRHKENVELFESGAILLYLADKCGELKSDEAKANAYSWVLWANASLDPICFKEDINGRVIDTGIKNETKGMRRLDDVLSKREWLSGDQFGVADVAVAAYLLYVPQFFQGVSFKRWPNVAKFMGRCCSRDSYAKAFGPRVQSYLIGELMKDVDGN